MTISDNYRDLNSQLHIDNKGFGTSGKKWADAVEFLNKKYKINSILDYGCGKQTLSSALPQLNITGYDPAIPELAARPSSADLVVCGDVLEHVEPEHLEQVINDLDQLTQKITFVVLSTREAKKILKDGRNAHLIVQPADWWIKKFESRFEILFLFESQNASELVFLMSSKKSKIRKIINKIIWLRGGRCVTKMFLACTQAYK
jgi:hypothetical protein